MLVLVGALAATYLLFAAASMRVALKAREVQVPNLTNRTLNDATALADRLGLTLQVDDMRRPDAKIAAGSRSRARIPPPDRSPDASAASGSG